MTPQGLAVLDAHRTKQATLAAIVVRQMLQAWPLLLAGRQADWLAVALAIMRSQRAASAALAGQYLAAYRFIELGTLDGFAAPPSSPLVDEAAITSMMTTGPVRIQKARERIAKPGQDPREVVLPKDELDKLAAAPARSAMRHAQNGARDAFENVTMADLGVVGWTRTTGAKPCWFCAMLASRGPVYDDDSFEESDPRFEGPGQHKVHDGCGCMLVPMYRRAGEEWPGRAREFDALWRQTGNALAFRQAYEGRAA